MLSKHIHPRTPASQRDLRRLQQGPPGLEMERTTLSPQLTLRLLLQHVTAHVNKEVRDSQQILHLHLHRHLLLILWQQRQQQGQHSRSREPEPIPPLMLLLQRQQGSEMESRILSPQSFLVMLLLTRQLIPRLIPSLHV